MAGFFFLVVAHCPDFSISQTFHPLSGPGLGQRKFGDHSRGAACGYDSDLQGSRVLFSTGLSVLPATWNSPMGFLHQSGISELYLG